jgi:regulator of replication initiation timing
MSEQTSTSSAIELTALQLACLDDVEDQQDREFLYERGCEIVRIGDRAAEAIKEITNAIEARANLAKGCEIAKIQDRFRGRRDGFLPGFYESLGFSMTTATRYANAWRASQELAELIGDDKPVGAVSDLALAHIYQLPETTKLEVAVAVAEGSAPSVNDIKALAKDPEVRLEKAQELLQEAQSRLEDGGDKKSATRAVANYEQQIAELQAQIEQERLATAQEHEERARLEVELQKLKFDDATARAERIKRISNNLTLSIPQTLADIQKFFAEKEEYPEKIREHLVQQATYLANYIGDVL